MRSPGQGPSVQDEEVRSVRYLSLGAEAAALEEEEEVVFVKLLTNPAPVRRLSSGAEGTPAPETSDTAGKALLLVVGTASGRTFFWDVDPTASSSTAPSFAAKVCAAVDGACTNPQQPGFKISVEAFTASTGGGGAPLTVAATTAYLTPAYSIVSLLHFDLVAYVYLPIFLFDSSTPPLRRTPTWLQSQWSTTGTPTST